MPPQDGGQIGRYSQSGEIFGVDLVEEVLELVDDLSGVFFGFFRGLLAVLVEEFVASEQRRATANSESNRIGGPGGDDLVAVGGREVYLGIKRALDHLGDDHLVERCTQFVDGCEKQIVGERPGRLDAFKRVMDRRGLGTPDVNREEPMPTLLFAQQHHGRVGRNLHTDTDEFDRDHEDNRTRFGTGVFRRKR
jgi:hypothetical protein